MAESERQEKMLSETVVKEAVGLGMKSPLRDSIVEAVEEAEGGPSSGGSRLPMAGALFGLGAAIGFLAGRQSPELEETSFEDLEEPEIIEDVMEEQLGGDEESTTETTAETETGGGSSVLSRLLLAVGAIAAVAVLRRRLSSGEEEEWEPIEEFEPATSDELDESEEEAAEDEEAEEEEAVETEAGGEDEEE